MEEVVTIPVRNDTGINDSDVPIPNECLRLIFSFVQNPRDLLRLACVCKQWKCVGDEEWFWTKFYWNNKAANSLELIGPEDTHSLEYVTMKERYLKTFIQGTKTNKSCELYLVLDKTKIYSEENTISGQLVLSVIDEKPFEFGGVFVYFCVDFPHHTFLKEARLFSLIEWYWKIPGSPADQNQETEPLVHSFRFHDHREKISSQIALEKSTLSKGTYHWNFNLKLPHSLAPTQLFKIKPLYNQYQYKFYGLIYGYPSSFSSIRSSRIVESSGIQLQVYENKNKILTHVTLHPSQTKFFKNDGSAKWIFTLDGRPYYYDGEDDIVIDGKYKIKEGNKPRKITLDITLEHKVGESHTQRAHTEIYRDIIPMVPSFTFKINFPLNAAFFDHYDGIYVRQIAMGDGYILVVRKSGIIGDIITTIPLVILRRNYNPPH